MEKFILFLFGCLFLISCGEDSIGKKKETKVKRVFLDASKMLTEEEFNKYALDEYKMKKFMRRFNKRRGVSDYTPGFNGVIPATFILSNLPRILDQNPYPACQSFAATYAKTILNAGYWGLNASLPQNQYSPVWLFNTYRPTGDEKHLSHVMNYLKKNGCDTINNFSGLDPYGQIISDQIIPDAASIARAKDHRFIGHFGIYKNSSVIERYKKILLAGYPIVAQMLVYNDFRIIGYPTSWDSNNPYDNNIYDSTAGEKMGGHAICLIGYDDAKQAFIFANSWGIGWGISIPGSTPTRGYGYISYDFCKYASHVNFQAYFVYVSTPYQVSPANNSTIVPLTSKQVTFKWKPALFAESYKLYLDGHPVWAGTSTEVTLTIDTTREHTWGVTAMVGRGTTPATVASVASPVIFKLIPNGKPIVTVSNPANNSVVNKIISCSGTATDSDGVQKVEWNINNSAWQTATGTTSWNFSFDSRNYVDGNSILYVRVTDNVGNSSIVQTGIQFLNNAFPAAQIVKEGDFNGDGKTDFVIIPSGNAVYTYLSQSGGNYSLVKYSPSSDYQTINTGKWFVGDFNGDGKTDLVHIVTVGTRDYMHPWYSNGNGTYTVHRYSPHAGYRMDSGEWRVGDFDGDGDSDLVHLVDSNYVHVHFSLRNGQFEEKPAFYPGGAYMIIGAGKWLTGDFNADGKTDLVHVVTIGSRDYMHPWYSNGNGTFAVHRYSPHAGYRMDSGEWRAGDFDGDGDTDLVHLVDAHFVHVHSSLRNGQFSQQAAYSPSPDYRIIGTGKWLTGDFNGDNKTDLIHIVTSFGGNYVHPWLSNGNGTFEVKRYSPSSDYKNSDGFWSVGKINGDTIDDLMHIPHSRYCHPWNSSGDGNFSVLKWFYE